MAPKCLCIYTRWGWRYFVVDDKEVGASKESPREAWEAWANEPREKKWARNLKAVS